MDYNNLDVKPGVEATKKLCHFFQSLNLDMHKDGISIPGLTLKYISLEHKRQELRVQLFKGNEELYQKYRDNLVGGPSIVFHHYHERNKTRIRGGTSFARGFLDMMPMHCISGPSVKICLVVSIKSLSRILIYVLKDVVNDSFFGVIECDVAVPENLNEHFAEMPPIFKNTEIQIETKTSAATQKLRSNQITRARNLLGVQCLATR